MAIFILLCGGLSKNLIPV